MRAGERKLWTEHLKGLPGVTLAPSGALVATKEGFEALKRGMAAAVAAIRPGAVHSIPPPDPKAPRIKGYQPTLVDGRRFDSKLEADRYLELKALRAAGQVRYFLRQVPFEISYRVTYRVDFLVVWNLPQPAVPEEGCALTTLTFEDTKGFLTETARVKLAAVRELYGVHVRLLRRADVKRMRA